MSALLDSLVEGFDQLALRDAGGLETLRRSALDRALETGLPGPRVERWKYTSLRSLERRSFAAAEAVPLVDVEQVALPSAPRLVFANGHYIESLSDIADLPDGVELRPLSDALQHAAPQELSFLARRFDADDEVFARLNVGLAVEGSVLRVAGGVQCATPVHLVFIGTPAAQDCAWALRHLIELGDGAQLSVIEHHVATLPHAHLHNTLVQVQLGEGATLSHLRIQQDAERATSILRTDVGMAGKANYRRCDLELGAALSRHELNVALHGHDAHLHANGVLFGDGRRHLDTRLGIDHIARDTSCLLEWRGLAGQSSHVVFHGGILIRQGGDGTDAKLSNKNLLLSDQAAIDTQPVLEIHADEVKAAHGATVGNLDPMALFYLRSRGLSEPQANALLTAAFCREVLGVFEEGPLRELARAALDVRLDTLA